MRLLAGILLLVSSSTFAQTWVNTYSKSNGEVVTGHYRWDTPSTTTTTTTTTTPSSTYSTGSTTTTTPIVTMPQISVPSVSTYGVDYGND